MINEINKSQATPEEQRLVDIWLDGKWIRTQFKEIKEGDTFRLFDPKSNEPIKDQFGNTVFVANTDVYLAVHKELKNVVYHVQIKGKEEIDVA